MVDRVAGPNPPVSRGGGRGRVPQLERDWNLGAVRSVVPLQQRIQTGLIVPEHQQIEYELRQTVVTLICHHPTARDETHCHK